MGFPAHNVKNNFYDLDFTIKQKPAFIRFNLDVKGPSYKAKRKTQSIEGEINKVESLSMKPEEKIIEPKYFDLDSYPIRVMNVNEILSEKIRALITRDEPEPRDVYDIYFLFNKKVNLDIELINKKLNYKQIKFSKELAIGKIRQTKEKWNDDLGLLMKNIPSYDKISTLVIDEIKKS